MDSIEGVRVPDEIWNAIVAGEQIPELKRTLLEQNSADIWVIGSQIDLNDDGYNEYIVMAAKPPLAGANITTFWIFAHDRNNYRLILQTSAFGLDVEEKVVGNFRTVVAFKISNNQSVEVEFKYANGHYQPSDPKVKRL
jgi:hypothetical protein